jgi:hypothetical protein
MQVSRHHFRDEELSRLAGTGRGAMDFREVSLQRFFSAFTLMRAEACADLTRSVENDVSGSLTLSGARRTEVEASW